MMLRSTNSPYLRAVTLLAIYCGISLDDKSNLKFELKTVPFVNAFQAFNIPKLPQFFKPSSTFSSATFPIAQKKAELLEAISNTENGKSASAERQKVVLDLVREIETSPYAPTENILTDPIDVNARALDGIWYLQYTSPSNIGDEDQFPDSWKPNSSPSNKQDPNVETRKFEAKGSVSAAGINVDTSNRVVQQIFDVTNQKVTNNVDLDFGNVKVGGSFYPSQDVSNRALVAFEECKISFNALNGFVLDLGFLFLILSKVRGTNVNGWLETTYLGDDLRIGRGNKGTMFVLTRDPNAVTP
mmetsp:Transcript_8835/g.12567  ORF Transcript_8835/g.12567 Transcript_8835/m.12567 type:complete len:300 (-) Transcript_8835:188-1087(-)